MSPVEPKKGGIDRIVALAALAALAGLSLTQAMNLDDGGDSHGIFTIYRFVHNNLNYPDVTRYLCMLHPAALEEKHVYTSYLSLGFPGFCTLFCAIFGLSVTTIKLSCLLFHAMLLWPMAVLARACRLSAAAALALLLLAPGLVAFMTRGDPWLAVSGMIFLLIRLLLNPAPADRARLAGIFATGFVSVFCFWMMMAYYVIFLAFVWTFNRLRKKDEASLFGGWTIPVSLLGGGGMALGVLFAWRWLAPEGTLPFLEYMQIRAPARTGFLEDPTVLLKALERMAAHIRNTFPLAFLVMGGLGAMLMITPRQTVQARARLLLFAAGLAYLVFLLLLGYTTIYHYYVIYPFYGIGIFLFLLAWHDAETDFRANLLRWVALGLLITLASYEWYKLGFWKARESSVDTFLASLPESDYLVRDTPFSTWPLHYRAPEKTLYLKPDHDRSVFDGLERRSLRAHIKTTNTITVLSAECVEETEFQIPLQSQLYFISEQSGEPFEKICSSRGRSVYRLLKAGP